MSDHSPRLLHITDPHIHADPGYRFHGVDTAASLTAVMEQALNEPGAPQAVLVTGDIAQDGTVGAYRRFSGIMEASGLPVHCIPGNHDDPAAMDAVLASPPFSLCGGVVHGSWQVVLLSSYRAGADGGHLGRQELARLKAALTHGDQDNALICVHHHPLPMGSRWLDGVGLDNADEFLSLIGRQQQVRGVVWGHVHQASDRMRQGVRYMSTPSTCIQFRPDSPRFAVDSKPPAYRWLNLQPSGTIDTRVVWLS